VPRRRSRRSRRRSFSLGKRVFLFASLALTVLLAANLTVRALGGQVHPFAIGRLRERVQALGFYAAHLVGEGDSDSEVEHALRQAAERHGVSARLLLAVAHTESSLVHTRISGTGAMGLMQLMPATAAELGVRDPFDVHQSADGGARYLKSLMGTFRGNLKRAVAAYNAGPTRVSRTPSLSALPSETREYVVRVLSRL
jgi:soluble lytic murein transglycosylase-like protein